LSRASSPVTLVFSLEALSRLLRGLPRSLEAPDDIAARAETSYAAMLMGVNLANSTTCLPHRMQYPVGALTGTEHARGVAALMPAWLSRTRVHAPARLALLASATGRERTGTSEDAALVVGAVLGLMDRIQLRPRLRDLGVERADLPRLAEMVEGAIENDPGPSDRAAILRLYEASY
jgi:alcohol dehydrogenase class IV